MTYFNAVKYIRSAPVGTENGSKGLLPLLNALGAPHKRMKYIRLAGSNGKTVCAEMLVSILSLSGYRVGCLRMPLREEPRENICIGNSPINIEEFCEYVNTVKTTVHDSSNEDPSFSASPLPTPTGAQALLTVALLAFQKHKCDLCIIESDHFGEDPSRFLPPPFAAVICGTIPSGDTAEISKIRSYICRGTQEIVSAPQDNDAFRVIANTCYSVNCRLTLPLRTSINVTKLSFRGTEFSYKGKTYALRLCGRFQISNAVLALEVLEMLKRKGFRISDAAVEKGFATLKIPAKFEVISINPLIMVDSTHSPVAIDIVCDALAEFRDQMGKRIRLCLPDGALVEQYVRSLTDRGYEIEHIIAPEGVTAKAENAELVHGKTKKAIAKKALESLDKETVLLISGDYPFVNPVRYELLAILGF